MIRGVNKQGYVVLGITRKELDALAAGKRVCFLSVPPTAPGPHICIYFGETNADAIEATREAYGGVLPEAVDYRTKPSSEDN